METWNLLHPHGYILVKLEQTYMNPAWNDFNLPWFSRTPKPTTTQINIQPSADQCEFQKAGVDILVSF